LLKALGSPPPNGVKFFAASGVLELTKDRSWLAKATNATNAINQRWKEQNARRKGRSVAEPDNTEPSMTALAIG
jgi:hypothetical protein